MAPKALERHGLSLKGREVGHYAWEVFLGCQGLAWERVPSWPRVLSVQGKGARPSSHWNQCDPVPIPMLSPGLGGAWSPALTLPLGACFLLDATGLSWQRRAHTLATKTGGRGSSSHAMARRGAPHLLPE